MQHLFNKPLFLLFFTLGQPLFAQNFWHLYRGEKGTKPDEQGWLYLSDPLFSAKPKSYSNANLAHLDTTAAAKDKAGFFSRLPLRDSMLSLPILNRQNGFELQWELEIVSENHNSPSRAGFSIIVLSEDLKGVELAFWSDEVWAQSDAPIFTHGEGASFNATRMTAYKLTVKGESYSLYANADLLFTGRLKDYSSFGRPYNLKNFIFFGDDTTSASGHAAVSSVVLTLPSDMD